MAYRFLTTKFGTYRLAKHEKATGQGIMNLIDIGNFEISKIATLIKLGNSQMDWNDEEAPYEKLDSYLAASEENSIITAYLDLLGELNTDLKMFGKNININKLKEELLKEVESMSDKLTVEGLKGLQNTIKEDKPDVSTTINKNEGVM